MWMQQMSDVVRLGRFPIVAMVLGWSVASVALASEDRVEHFEGLPATSVEQALSHLSIYNHELAAIVAQGELNAEDSYAIHQLTYTLENALEQLAVAMTQTQAHLESIHWASEANRGEVIIQESQAYLASVEALFGSGASTALKP